MAAQLQMGRFEAQMLFATFYMSPNQTEHDSLDGHCAQFTWQVSIIFSPLKLLVGWIPCKVRLFYRGWDTWVPCSVHMSLTHTSSHNVSLCGVLHDSPSTSPVPVWPCNPHHKKTTPISNLLVSIVCLVRLKCSQKMIHVHVMMSDFGFLLIQSHL